MRFDRLHPNAHDGFQDPNYPTITYCEDDPKGHCAVCGRITQWIDFGSEDYICSVECFDTLWRDYEQACRKLDQGIADQKQEENLLYEIHCILHLHSALLSCTTPDMRREIVSIIINTQSGASFWSIVHKHYPDFYTEQKWIDMVGKKLLEVVEKYYG